MVEFAIWAYKYYLGRLTFKRYKEIKKTEELAKRKEIIKKYQCLADQMGSRCRDIIIEFIKTNNEPIEYHRWVSVCNNFMISEDLFFYKTKNSNNREIIKLTKEVYDIYSYIYIKYNKIGNF